MSPLKSTFGAASAFGWIPRAAGSSTPLSGVEFTVWGGGSTSGPGGIVVKKTGQTIAGSSNISVVIGAANSSSEISGAGFTTATAGVSPTVSGNIVDGTATTYSTFGSPTTFQNNCYYGNYGWGYGYYCVNNPVYVGGGAPGSAGNGGNPTNAFPSYGQTGNGGASFASVTSIGLAGFPATGVGAGGPGYTSSFGSSMNVFLDDGGYASGYVSVFYGTSNPNGANTGNGYGGYYAASSGGFTMRYSNTQLPLTSTTGTVVYLNSGGYHNYFWKSTGSFLV